LENNQEIAKEFTISDLPNGQYRIEVFLTAKEEEAKAVTDLIVKNSFSNGTGILGEQMDPHTIEIDMEGKKVAFQLSEAAKKQLPVMKEGELVAFVYNENELDQKIIEKFIIE
jgi:NurA-like 5'-3' nuclease